MNHTLIRLASILIATTIAATGCNGNKSSHGALSSKDKAKMEQPETIQAAPETSNNAPDLGTFIVDRTIVEGAAGPGIGEVFEAINNQLLTSLENHIRLEAGISIDQFFAIKKCLNPCLKSPSTCYQDMEDYYHESIYQMMRSLVQLDAITSTLIIIGKYKTNNTSLDQISVLFTIGFASMVYRASSQSGRLQSDTEFNEATKQIIELSPVSKKIYNSNLDFKSKQRLIGIWFMRQIPYAIEDVFKLINQKGIDLTTKDLDENTIENKTLAYLNLITYDSKPANIDWSRYRSTSSKNTEAAQTSLHLAAEKGNVEEIKALIANGADINAIDERGNTSLHLAALKGHAVIAKMLISSGADVNAKRNSLGDTPLHLAVMLSPNLDLINTLIAAGADVNAKDNKGYTPLHTAATGTKLQILEMASDTTKKDIQEVTENYVDILKRLIAAGSDVNAKDNNGKTPLDIAEENNRTRALASFLRTQMKSNDANDSEIDSDSEADASTAQRYGIQYVREITYKGKSKPSWIILKDPKGRYCAIVTSSKYPVLELDHYCIPFSGNDADLKDSFAGNRVAEIDFPDHKKCKNVEFVSDNDYCNRFNKAFEDMANKEDFFSVTEICRNDPDLDNDFRSHICEHLELEHDLD